MAKTQFDVSDTGTALYGLSRFIGVRELVEVTLDGVETPTPLGGGTFDHPRYSPDGRYIAYEQDDQVWVYDRETGANDQLTTEGANRFPVWSADGRYVYYATAPPDLPGYEGFRRLADRSEGEERLYGREGYVYPLSASPSGNELLMNEWVSADRGMDLLIMTEGQDSVIFTDYLRADWNEMHGAISPNGKWVVYVSDESDVIGGYVRSFPEGALQVRLTGGDFIGADGPVWAPDGTAIYYVDPNRGMMKALVTPGEDSPVARPQMLFEGRWARGTTTSFSSANMDLHPDGETFVLVTDPSPQVTESESSGMPVRLVVNWFEELKRLAGN